MAVRTAAVLLARKVALGLPLALLAGAYVSQYGFGLYPCEMCWWQRYPHFAAVGFAVLAYATGWARVFTGLAALAIVISGAIGAYHAGVEYGWWQGLTTCTAPLPPGGDPLAAVLNAPLVRCDVAPWTLAGISLAGWNFLFSLAGALAIAILLAKSVKEPI